MALKIIKLENLSFSNIITVRYYFTTYKTVIFFSNSFVKSYLIPRKLKYVAYAKDNYSKKMYLIFYRKKIVNSFEIDYHSLNNNQRYFAYAGHIFENTSDNKHKRFEIVENPLLNTQMGGVVFQIGKKIKNKNLKKL